MTPFLEEISHPVIVLVGPTAIGKTSLSLNIAEKFECEIISMDSMQVYRFMDIGTAKVSIEEQNRIKHHLIDIRNPDEQFDAAQFVSDSLCSIRDIINRGKTPLITGGTGLYLNSLVNGLFKDIDVDENTRSNVKRFFEENGRETAYQKLITIDPKTAKRVHINDTQRLLRGLEIFEATGKTWSKHLEEQEQQHKQVIFKNLIAVGLHCERNLLHERIALRANMMMGGGFPEEVEKLLEMGYSDSLPSMQSIGYRQVNQYISGKINGEQTVEDITSATKKYAKRQLTWFKKNDYLQWVPQDDENKALSFIKKQIAVT